MGGVGGVGERVHCDVTAPLGPQREEIKTERKKDGRTERKRGRERDRLVAPG